MKQKHRYNLPIQAFLNLTENQAIEYIKEKGEYTEYDWYKYELYRHGKKMHSFYFLWLINKVHYLKKCGN